MLLNRTDAKAAGHTKFYNGVPCPKGHVGPRRTHKGDCAICADIAIKNWTENNRDHKNAVSKQYRLNNKPKVKAYHDAKRKSLKFDAIHAYGGKCNCCGETEMDFLTIDHVNGGGIKHRKTIGSGLYSWLKQNNYPDGFQTLCFNCNCAKGLFGTCPHQRPNFECIETTT